MFIQIIKIAKRIILAQNIREFKNYLRQKLNKDNTLSQIQKSTIIGNKAKEITELFKNQGLNNQNYQNKALNFIIQKIKNINDKDTLLRLITQDLIAIISTIKNYDYIVKNMTNQLDHNQKNINNFNTYQELFTFVNDLEQQRKSLEELQERRALGLPFKKLYSKGGYSMYEINQEDKQNFQSMFNGQTGTISKTSWCVTFKTNDYFQSYKPPFYLIMNSSNTAQALICIHKHQFKDIKNDPYQHNNKAVYDLVFQLLNDNHIPYDDYKGDFQILIKYLSQQKKDMIIDYYIEHKNINRLIYLPQYVSKNQQKEKIVNILFEYKQFYYLFNGILKGQLPNILTKNQKQEIINFYIDHYDNNLFYYIKTGNLPELTDQQKQEIINKLIEKKLYYDKIFQQINKGNLPELTDQQKQEIIYGLINQSNCSDLFDYIKTGKLPELTDQQKQEIINNLIDKCLIYTLYVHIEDGNLPKLTDQQKQEIINKIIGQKIDYDELFKYIKQGDLPELSQQQKQEIIKKLIKRENIYVKLFKYIKQGDLPELSQQQKQEIIKNSINQHYFTHLFDYIQQGKLPKLTKQQEYQVIDYYINISILLLFTLFKSYNLTVTDQQKQYIINKLIQQQQFSILFNNIDKGNLPPLTEQQQQKIKQINPDIKLSKKLVKIAKIIRL